jgi:predicted metal-binding protein
LNEAESRGGASPSVILSVCTTCKVAGGDPSKPFGRIVFEAIAAAFSGFGPDVAVRPVQCLSACRRPCVVALAGPERFTFIFGDINPDTGPAALSELVDRYKQVPLGFVPWRQRPRAIRLGILARVPATVWSPDDGRAPQ